MKIEIQYNSVQVDLQELQEHYPEIVSAIKSHSKKKRIYRKRKPKITVAMRINEILDDIDAG